VWRWRLPAVIAVVGFGLLAVAWAMADPPGAPPDEATNFVRAVAVGRGEWRGTAPAPAAPAPAPAAPAPAVAAAPVGADPLATMLAWQLRTTRVFDVPARLDPAPFACLPVDPNVSAACLSARPPPGPGTAPGRTGDEAIPSYVGTYQPVGFVAAGVASRWANDAATALRLARLGDVALWLALVAMALAVLGDRRRPGLSLLGPVVAVTPMAVFLGASVSPNGIEIAAAVALWAALLRVTRPDPPPARAWAVVAVSGVLLAFTRSLGPVFLAFPVAAAIVLLGPRRAWSRLRLGGGAATAAVVAVAAAVAGSTVWEAAFQPHAAVSAAVFRHWAMPSVRELPEVFREHVGLFGPLAVPMNAAAYWVWAAITAAVVVAAIAVGTRRERLALVATLAAVPVVSVVVSAAVVHQTGFGMQGRYISALAVAVPLLAGEVLWRNRDKVSARAGAALVAVAGGSASAVQLLAWYSNARRYAVGTDGPRLFIGSAQWSPPAGWWVWLAVAVAGAGLVATAAMVAAAAELSRSRADAT
jgi:hypothetical protein